MIRPRHIAELAGRTRGLRPVRPTGRTTVRGDRSGAYRTVGELEPDERARRRAVAKLAKAARRLNSGQGARSAGRRRAVTRSGVAGRTSVGAGRGRGHRG